MNTEAQIKNETVALLNASRESIGPGTIVTLKTGGPAMVITERTADKALAYWHEDSGELATYWFPIVALKVKPV